MNATLLVAGAVNPLHLQTKTGNIQWHTLPRSTALHQLSELFRGNGWIVSPTDGGTDRAILLSHPKSPQTAVLMVKLVLQSHPLTYTEALRELKHFENHLAPHYKCSQFAIIAPGGIERKAEKLERFNLLLQDEGYLQELEKHYSPSKIKEPRVQLFAHNKQTYKKVSRLLNNGVLSVAVVQATGTGKSFLIAKLLQDFSEEKRLVMAPSIYIIDQLKEHIRWEAGSIEFMTYARSMNLSQSEINALAPKLIVLDEYHRCGAEEWGRGVQNILNAFPGAVKIGTSATPVRYMDGGRDMSEELFGNNVAENLSLAQAIVRNILPMPKYVCALYTLTEVVDELKEKIKKSKAKAETKRKMLLDLDAATINWELSNGVSDVLKKHLAKTMRKFIVFCRDEEHLREMETTVSAWFKKATGGQRVITYRIFDNEPKSFDNLEAFKNADSTIAIHLLFSINMLNEGLHVAEVSGVVLLRPTASPNIFYQQIGRCLKVGSNQTPVIFDLVNNFKSIHSREFLYDLEFDNLQYKAERAAENLEDNCPAFTLIDEVREITEVFGQIRFKLDDWDAMYERLAEYKEQFGNCDVPAGEDSSEHRQLWKWLHRQRRKYSLNTLEPGRRDKLLALGIEWKLHQLTGSRDEGWEKHFKRLCAFRTKYGHCNAIDQHNDFPKLHNFVKDQRYRYGIGTLEEDRFNKLLSIDFEFNRQYNEGQWQIRFDELVAFKKEHGHLRVNDRKNHPLYQWIRAQRRFFRANQMDASRQQKLNSIGFEWTDGPDVVFEKKLSQLIAWYQQHQHWKIPEGNSLCGFAATLRKNYTKKKLSDHIIEQLQALHFRFGINETGIEKNEKRMQQLAAFVKQNGHSNVIKNNENYAGLSQWLSTQRKLYGRGVLKQEFIKKMEALGVDWNYRQNFVDGRWNNQYEKLVCFYKRFGKAYLREVRQNYSLQLWCSAQRAKYKKGQLSKEQIKKLNAIDFKWEVMEDLWEENFALLSAFKQKHGHCRVPQKKPGTALLSTWCGNVRKSYKEGKLSAERIKRLEAVGFDWNVMDAQWKDQYEVLEDYLRKNALEDIKKNDALYIWISEQRKKYKKKKLSEEKIMLLNMQGIDWNPVQRRRLNLMK